MTKKKYTVAYVDDEEHNLRVFRSGFRRHFNVILFSNPLEAIETIRQGNVDVLITDQRMPDMTGTDMIEVLREDFPELISIIVTGYSDIDTVTHAVNKCNIFRYITKPYDTEDLKMTLDKAVQIRSLKRDKEKLLTDLQEANLSLEQRVMERTLELESANNKLTQSIEYAKGIQSAVLATDTSFEKVVAEDFCLFLPQNIVSGDFYFKKELGDKLLIACFDCTGHGVPGAFLSILGVSALERAIALGHDSPGAILKEINNQFNKQLNQSPESTRDGMEGGVVILDKKRDKLFYCGSRGEITLVKQGEIERVRSSKIALGDEYWQNTDHLSISEYKLSDISILYMYSDGYRDQFNESGRRIMTSGFQKLISESHQEPLSVQKEIFEKHLTNWKGKEDQTDDVMVLAYRFK